MNKNKLFFKISLYLLVGTTLTACRATESQESENTVLNNAVGTVTAAAGQALITPTVEETLKPTITQTPDFLEENFFEEIMSGITPTLWITPEVTEKPEEEDTVSSDDTLLELEEEMVAVFDTDIYEQPVEDSKKVGVIPKSERVLVTGIYVVGQFTETTNWYRVTYEEKEGYVRADCLHLLNSQITPRTAIPKTTITESEKKIQVENTPLFMENVLYFEFLYTTETLQCWSENPDIVEAALFECGYDFGMNANVAGIMLYGISNGECELVITDGTVEKEVRRMVTVEKPEANMGFFWRKRAYN